MGDTSKGIDFYNNMVDSATKVGVSAPQRKVYSMDGEAVYTGDGTTADTCKSLVKAEDPANEVIKDPPHAGELLKEDMHREFVYIVQVHDVIKGIYGNYVSQGKKITGMERIAKEMGVDWRELHYIFAIRMVESECIA